MAKRNLNQLLQTDLENVIDDKLSNIDLSSVNIDLSPVKDRLDVLEESDQTFISHLESIDKHIEELEIKNTSKASNNQLSLLQTQLDNLEYNTGTLEDSISIYANIVDENLVPDVNSLKNQITKKANSQDVIDNYNALSQDIDTLFSKVDELNNDKVNHEELNSLLSQRMDQEDLLESKIDRNYDELLEKIDSINVDIYGKLQTIDLGKFWGKEGFIFLNMLVDGNNIAQFWIETKQGLTGTMSIPWTPQVLGGNFSTGSNTFNLPRLDENNLSITRFMVQATRNGTDGTAGWIEVSGGQIRYIPYGQNQQLFTIPAGAIFFGSGSAILPIEVNDPNGG